MLPLFAPWFAAVARQEDLGIMGNLFYGFTPCPSPRGAGSDMPCCCFVYGCCLALQMLLYCFVVTLHITPLSPWRGAGGEAFLFLILVRKRHKIGDEECGNGGHEGENEEIFVAQPIAKRTTGHTWQHHTEVHYARCKGVMCHLMLAWCYLLHHEKG